MVNPEVLESTPKSVTGMQNNSPIKPLTIRPLQGRHGLELKKSSGFTLIEILVVVFIVGITLGFALLAFGDFGSKRRIFLSAEQFVNYVKFVQQRAILGTSTLGITVHQNSYQTLYFQPPKTWQTLSQNTFSFPSNAIVMLETNKKSSESPQIIINSTGDMTPFTLTFGSTNEENIAEVIGKDNGNVFLKVPKQHE